ncbi:TPM domain-containing protein [Hymenobacter jejuensis]|uniref:TPM domain-containing protein n=1 Tax=Hymenobacter jejuensis TaxID=2502781 RepID=A0A5B7ZZE6_9BACT|nr:TPM domain-containing protein [Hymenobacter jejuensis]QDA60239.1 hypothetical protein FHG12_08995 [Hymenobacter jejuensis]
MHRFLFLILFLVSAGLGAPTAGAQGSAEGLPPRPSPFRFVNDQASLLSPADAKKLESGLRRYADNTGTQIVVVTVPTLGGRDVADYGRALGESWGIGQRDKNNGIVLLLAGQEHKVTIQAGSGLRAQITPELTARVINQDMTPSFKQGRYFSGLRTGLNSLMLAANPDSDPRKNQPQPTTSPATATSPAAGSAASDLNTNDLNTSAAATEPASAPFSPSAATTPEPAPSGPGMGTLVIGALAVGGVIWFLVRMFRRRTPAAGAPGNAPDFYSNRPNSPAGGNPGNGNYNRGPVGPQGQAPDFYSNRSGMGGGGGSGIGGMLATGAAAAAGAYLGNRMASGHDTSGSSLAGAGLGNDTPHSLDPNSANVGGTSSGGFPALEGNDAVDNTPPDYFSSDDAGTDGNADYFSSDDNSSYDDLSSDDTGGGGFDDNSDNSGSW